ncbi:MAG: hypothetical protein AB7V26_13315 [Lysobacterales bacterium]
MTEPQAFKAFIAPWRQTFPALALAELFASGGEAEPLLARTVLLLECCDAAWRVSDTRVGTAKLGWWAEEWPAIQRGQGGHPLAVALRPLPGAAPVAVLWRELDAQGAADETARFAAYAAIADDFARAFHRPESRHFAGFRFLAEVLSIGRHLAAVRVGQSLAVAALPRDWRARHQLQADAGWLASAAGRAATQAASLALAERAGAHLQQSLAAVPAISWPGQRGARVLAALALKELRDLGRPEGRMTRFRDLYMAWRLAMATAG